MIYWASKNMLSFLVWQFHALEPGMRNEREFLPASAAAVPALEYDDLSRPAPRTKHVLTEHDAADKFLDLPLRRYLIDLVHTSHDSEVVPSDLHYPCALRLTNTPPSSIIITDVFTLGTPRSCRCEKMDCSRF